MARVETDAQALVPSECDEDGGELVERAADRPTGAGGVLHQHPGAVVAPVEHLLECGDEALEACLEAGAGMGAVAEDGCLGFDRTGSVDRLAHPVDALPAELVA